MVSFIGNCQSSSLLKSGFKNYLVYFCWVIQHLTCLLDVKWIFCVLAARLGNQVGILLAATIGLFCHWSWTPSWDRNGNIGKNSEGISSSSLQGIYLRVHKHHISGTPCFHYPCELQGSGSLDFWHNSFAFQKFQLFWGNLAATESSGLLLFFISNVGATTIEDWIISGVESVHQVGVSALNTGQSWYCSKLLLLFNVLLQAAAAAAECCKITSRAAGQLQGAAWSRLAQVRDPFLSQSGPTGSAAFNVVYL